MRRLLVFALAFPFGALAAGACGGSTATVDAGASITSDGAAPGDATFDGAVPGDATFDGAMSSDADSGTSADGAACVTIDPTSYDRACTGDPDCTTVAAGTICTGGCACSFASIAVRDLPKYKAATAGIKPNACPCAAPGQPRCVQKACTLCTFGPNNPPGCPDGG